MNYMNTPQVDKHNHENETLRGEIKFLRDQLQLQQKSHNVETEALRDEIKFLRNQLHLQQRSLLLSNHTVNNMTQLSLAKNVRSEHDSVMHEGASFNTLPLTAAQVPSVFSSPLSLPLPQVLPVRQVSQIVNLKETDDSRNCNKVNKHGTNQNLCMVKLICNHDLSDLRHVVQYKRLPIDRSFYWDEHIFHEEEEITALHLAATRPSAEALELLLSHGFPVEVTTKCRKLSPFHFIAIYKGSSAENIKVLIDYGIDFNVKDIAGRTALHWACIRKYYRIVCELVKIERFDIKVKDNAGNTALKLARNLKFEQGITLLQSIGRTNSPKHNSLRALSEKEPRTSFSSISKRDSPGALQQQSLPISEHPISDERQKRIQSSISEFLHHMDANQVLLKLFEKGFIENDVYTSIRKVASTKEKNEFIIFEIIFVSNNETYDNFAAILHDMGSRYLAARLDDKYSNINSPSATKNHREDKSPEIQRNSLSVDDCVDNVPNVSGSETEVTDVKTT